MTPNFEHSIIGKDFLKKNKTYPVDALLEYLSGLLEEKKKNPNNAKWQITYTLEIAAVKDILKTQTSGKKEQR